MAHKKESDDEIARRMQNEEYSRGGGVNQGFQSNQGGGYQVYNANPTYNNNSGYQTYGGGYSTGQQVQGPYVGSGNQYPGQYGGNNQYNSHPQVGYPVYVVNQGGAGGVGGPQGGGQGGYPQTVVIHQMNNGQDRLSETEERWVVLLHASRTVKWLSIIDTVFVILFVFSVGFFVVLIFWMPVMGYLGAKKFNHKMIAVYLTFIVIIILLRVLILALFPNPINVIVQALGIAIEIYIGRFVNTFYKLCVNLTDEERYALEMTSNGLSTQSQAR
mmetsp:Transcript_15129/g.16823  ORF Transcript_15129/g.16823 Transcript_15129/m.16823 type:complete len:273 (-) Transcript_15129:813-1631(-)